MQTAATDGAANGNVIILRLGTGESPLCIVPGSSRTYRVLARDALSCSALVHDILDSPQAELVPSSGGLLSSLSVIENIVLPAAYHGRVAKRELAQLIYRHFDTCGVPEAETEALCARPSPDLSKFERRLVALVRSLMMRPPLLAIERAFEGLTEDEMQRVARFPEYYRRSVPAGTVVMLDLAGMPAPKIAVDVEARAQ